MFGQGGASTVKYVSFSIPLSPNFTTMYYLEGYYKYSLTDNTLSKIFIAITALKSNNTISGQIIIVNPANTTAKFKAKIIEDTTIPIGWNVTIYATNSYYTLLGIQYALLQDNTAGLDVNRRYCKMDKVVDEPSGATNLSIKYIKPTTS